MADKAGEQPEIQKAGDQLGKETTAETFRSDLGDRSSGDNQVSQKLPDIVKDALGLNSVNEVRAYVDGLQNDGKRVIPTIEETGKDLKLSTEQISKLSGSVVNAMTREQNSTELNRSFSNIAKIAGGSYETRDLSNLDSEGAAKLMDALAKTIGDFKDTRKL
mgnify:CR=1 FL=1